MDYVRQLTEFAVRIRDELKQTQFAEDHGSEDLLAVSSSLLRGCLEAAESLLMLLQAGRHQGTAGLQRAVFEYCSELEFLAKSEDRNRDAIKATVNATIELIETLANAELPPAGMKERNEQELAKFESSHPGVVAEVRDQRKGPRKHWSGLSRTQVYAAGDASRLAYKILSWEAHPEMGPIRDVSVTRVKTTLILEWHDATDSDDIVQQIAWATGGHLFYAWNTFAEMWGRTALKQPGRGSA